MRKYLSLICLLVLSGLFCVSCSEEEKADRVEFASTVAPTPAPAKKVDSSPESMYPKEIREEVFGDEETFSTPRVMFTAKYGDNSDYHIWSMRLDGSDRRLVASPDMFFNAAIVHKPIRSPDNRYIALSLERDGFFRAIIDLKDKKAIRVMNGGGYPYFNWTEDSKNLILNSDTDNYSYHIPTRELTERPNISSYGRFLLPSDKRFVAMKSDGFWVHNFDGKVLKKHSFGLPSHWKIKDPVISLDGKMLFFKTEGSGRGHVHWASVDTGKIIGSGGIDDILGGGYKPIFAVETGKIYVPKGRKTTYVDLDTKEKKDVKMKEHFIWQMYSMGDVSLMNYRFSK